MSSFAKICSREIFEVLSFAKISSREMTKKFIRENKFSQKLIPLRYSGPHVPAFGQNTERYSASLCIQSECGKIRTRITPITAAFHAMKMSFVVLISSRTVQIAKKLYSSFYI